MEINTNIPAASGHNCCGLFRPPPPPHLTRGGVVRMD